MVYSLFSFHFFLYLILEEVVLVIGDSIVRNMATGILGLLLFVVREPLEFLKTLITPSYKIDTFIQSFGSFGFLLFCTPQHFLLLFLLLWKNY